MHKEVSGLLRNEKVKKEKLAQLGYEYPGFEALLTANNWWNDFCFLLFINTTINLWNFVQFVLIFLVWFLM